MKLKLYFGYLLTSMLFVFLSFGQATAQTTAFTYQGRLTDGASAANGTYEMQFKLFDSVGGPTQIGSTITNNSVSVVNGVFTVALDFGSSPFAAGAARWLEIGVRKSTDPPGFTLLTPRQQVTSAPYAVYTLGAAAADSLSTACVGCVTDVKVGNGISYSKLTGVPTSLPPSGAAGGGLTGTYPNPTIANNAVTSARIADGEIVNADISPSAAIATTKISGLGTLATVSPGGTANTTTFLRGDNTWAAIPGGSPIFAARATNLILNTGTPVNVISINLEANKTYQLDGVILGQRVGAANGAGTFDLVYTGTATTDYGLLFNSFVNDTTIDSTPSYNLETTSGTSTFTATVGSRLTVGGYLRTTTAGTLTIRGARATTNTTVDLNVREGSYLIARPLN